MQIFLKRFFEKILKFVYILFILRFFAGVTYALQILLPLRMTYDTLAKDGI